MRQEHEAPDAGKQKVDITRIRSCAFHSRIFIFVFDPEL